MTLIQWLRDRFGLSVELSSSQLNEEFLKRAAKLAKKKKVEIFMGGPKVLADALTDPKDYAFIVVIKASKIQRPKQLRQWFKDIKI